MKTITLIVGKAGILPFMTVEAAKTSYAYGGCETLLQVQESAFAAEAMYDRVFNIKNIITNVNSGEKFGEVEIEVREMPEMISALDRGFPTSVRQIDNFSCSKTQGNMINAARIHACTHGSQHTSDIRIVAAYDFDCIADTYRSYIGLDKNNDAYLYTLQNKSCSWDGLTREQEKDVKLEYIRGYGWEYIEDNWDEEIKACTGQEVHTGYTYNPRGY